MLDREELGAWLRLLETPGVGRESARHLLQAFGSPGAAIDASTAARRSVVGPQAAGALAQPDPGFADLLESTWQWLAAAGDEARDVLVLGDPRYPELLLNSADPPLLLYARGQVARLNSPSIAIVGSRNPTAQGLENARAFAAHLGRAGFTIVSGLALGIDAAAHDGALEAGAGTIAIVGTGLDRVYPGRHRSLALRIAANGVIASEFAIGTPALPQNFPIRNRIIAGLARGTLVVEAALQSGSLITARLAAENGRDVFAIPGSIHSPQSRGCHALIRQGAKLVENVGDVLEELRLGRGTVANASSGSADLDLEASTPHGLLRDMGFDPVSLDVLCARSGFGVAQLQAQLLDLELAGSVARLPGGLFQRVALG